MQIYRITGTKDANDLNGTGCLHAPGRWNKQGTLVLYTSEHVSLAKLEILADSTETPDNMSLVILKILPNASCLIVNTSDLPAAWNQLPYHPDLAALTDKWVAEQKY